MTTLAQVAAEVTATMIDIEPSIASQVETFVLDAMRELEDAHGFFHAMRTAASYWTEDGQAILADTLPSDWLRIRDLPNVTEGDGSSYVIGQLTDNREINALFNLFDLTEKGRPQYGIVANNSLQIRPRADANAIKGAYSSTGNYKVVFPYWKRISVGMTSGDSNWFTDNARNALVFYACAQVARWDNDGEKLGIYTQLWENEKRRLIRTDKKVSFGEDSILRPRISADATIEHRRF